MRKPFGILILLTVAGLLSAQAPQQQQAEKLLEAARHKEVMEGDLKGAAEQYRKIASQFAKQSDVAARALYQLGQCQEKLGQAEARKSYERIVREYGGSQQFASAARARLAAIGGGLASPASGPANRLVWDNAIDVWGSVSADGRYLSFVDWSTGDLAVRDLTTGQNRRVTNKGGYEKAKAEAEGNQISPDGKRIAYSWQNWADRPKKDSAYSLRIINTDGTGERVLQENSDTVYNEPGAWSPDGKSLTAWLVHSSNQSSLAVFDMESGSRRIVVPASATNKLPALFSPDGKWIAYVDADRSRPSESNVQLVASDGSQAPVTLARGAGLMAWIPERNGVILKRTRGDQMSLSFLGVQNGRPVGVEQPLPVVGMPTGSSMGVTKQGTLYYSTMNRRIEAWIGTLDLATGKVGEPAAKVPAGAFFLVLNGANVRFSPDGSQWLASASVPKSLMIRSMDGTVDRTITPRMTTITRVEWMHDGKSLLVSGQGPDRKPGIYSADPDTGATKLLFDGEHRAFVPSRNGKRLYSATPNGVSVCDLESGKQETFVELDLRNQGVVDVRLSPDGARLAIRSAAAFLGIIDLASRKVTELYRGPKDSLQMFRGMDWSSDGQYVVTARRTDHVDKQAELRVFPASGQGESRAYPLPMQVRSLAMHPDGKHIGATVFESRAQVWTLDNFLPPAFQ